MEIERPYYWDGPLHDEEHKKYYWEEAKGEIHFKNDDQLYLWRLILGQISDGYWENKINNWRFWYELKPIVDGALGWKRYDDVVPLGDEWPTDYYPIMENLWNEMPTGYSHTKFEIELADVASSVATSLRKIGYLS